MWGDCRYHASRDPEDESFYLSSEGFLAEVLNGYHPTPAADELMEQFGEFLEQRGWWWDLMDPTMIVLNPIPEKGRRR
jgi:hypothetical protein